MNRALQAGKPTGGEASTAQAAIHLDVKKPEASGKGAELTKDCDLQPPCDFTTFPSSRLCLSLAGLLKCCCERLPSAFHQHLRTVRER